jgi:hypothetical protein
MYHAKDTSRDIRAQGGELAKTKHSEKQNASRKPELKHLNLLNDCYQDATKPSANQGPVPRQSQGQLAGQIKSWECHEEAGQAAPDLSCLRANFTSKTWR